MKKKILFFHFDLGGGGAEKVLVNLVNKLNPEKYDITLYTVFNYGVYKDSIAKHIKRKSIFNKQFKGFITLAKLLSPRLLHRLFIRDKYDIEIAFYHRFPARIISGCPSKDTKKYLWVHSRMRSMKDFFSSFRNLKEGKNAYYSFNRIAFVAQSALDGFIQQTGWNDLNCKVVHNLIDAEDILLKSKECCDISIDKKLVNMCSVGRLNKEKGYLRLIKCLGSLKQLGLSNWHFYLLGQGTEEHILKKKIQELDLTENISLLGFSSNPYKYVANMGLFVCSSYVEGYSTAVVESVIVGTPVLTTDCSGMKEILGDKAGLIVENNDEALLEGLKKLICDRSLINYYREGAIIRRNNIYSIENELKEFETFIEE